MQLQIGVLNYKPDLIIFVDGYMEVLSTLVYFNLPGTHQYHIPFSKFVELTLAFETFSNQYLIKIIISESL
jgi:hypothetical protein